MVTKKEKTKNIVIVVVLLIGVLIFFQSRALSLLEIPGYEEGLKNEVWQGIPVTITSTYFRTLTNSKSIPFQTLPQGFCGDNNEQFTVSNVYGIGTDLSLSSSFKTVESACLNENFIKMEGVFPAGNLTMECTGTINHGFQGQHAYSHCSLNGEGVTVTAFKEQAGKTVTQTFIRQVSEGENIEVIVLSYGGEAGTINDASMTSRLSFLKDTSDSGGSSSTSSSSSSSSSSGGGVCEGEECETGALSIVLVISVAVLIIGGLTFLYLKIRKKRR